MHEVIDRLASDGLLRAQEAELAHLAECAGTLEHTIGNEAEVLVSAAGHVPRLRSITAAWEVDQDAIQHEVENWGYGVDRDGCYELQSPSSTHPVALALATYAITRAGYLPNGTTGLVTAHISVVSPAVEGYCTDDDPLIRDELQSHPGQFVRTVTMLRVLEQLGHTSPNRLRTPVMRASQNFGIRADKYWNAAGIVGVEIERTEFEQGWNGGNRIQLRTLGFHDPQQFGRELCLAYYFSRGLLAAEGSVAADIYNQFEQWVRDYFKTSGLPEFPSDLIDDPCNITLLRGYFWPYAEHLEATDRSSLISRACRTESELAEEFGMQAITLPPYTP